VLSAGIFAHKIYLPQNPSHLQFTNNERSWKAPVVKNFTLSDFF
jgi:hypothetical protein